MSNFVIGARWQHPTYGVMKIADVFSTTCTISLINEDGEDVALKLTTSFERFMREWTEAPESIPAETLEEYKRMIVYYWEDKGNLERWSEWKKAAPYFPEIAKAWRSVTAAEFYLGVLINNLK